MRPAPGFGGGTHGGEHGGPDAGRGRGFSMGRGRGAGLRRASRCKYCRERGEHLDQGRLLKLEMCPERPFAQVVCLWPEVCLSLPAAWALLQQRPRARR